MDKHAYIFLNEKDSTRTQFSRTPLSNQICIYLAPFTSSVIHGALDDGCDAGCMLLHGE